MAVKGFTDSAVFIDQQAGAVSFGKWVPGNFMFRQLIGKIVD
jgi:hypothetical protein